MTTSQPLTAEWFVDKMSYCVWSLTTQNKHDTFQLVPNKATSAPLARQASTSYFELDGQLQTVISLDAFDVCVHC
jgi:hypothetical protein